jgi:signal transduction histidine kinase
MNSMEKFLAFLDQRIEEFGGAQYRAFGIFGVINYPVGYFLLQFLGTNESIGMRLVATFLSIPLVFVDRWPPSLKKYLNLYWLLTLLYCLPTFGTYSLLSNQFSHEWLLNYSVGLFILFLLVDYVLLITLYGLGIFLGYLFFKLSGQNLIPLEKVPTTFLYLYAAMLVIGAIFSRNKEYYTKMKTIEAKYQALQMQAGAIAHEMRTPLAAAGLIADGMALNLPILVHNQELAQERDHTIPHIHPITLEGMAEIPSLLKSITRSAFTVIDMVLMNLKKDVPQEKPEKCSILTCVQTALQEYPLTQTDKGLVISEITQDFEFYGHPVLVKHVFFNLIKNALYYVKAAGKGNITIWTELGDRVNKVHVKDTGKGIPKDYLPHVFDQFFTRTDQGNGIGLAFCKMVMTKIGGDITCNSIEGEFTQFTLIFPTSRQ